MIGFNLSKHATSLCKVCGKPALDGCTVCSFECCEIVRQQRGKTK